jgi:hypothetical protein
MSDEITVSNSFTKQDFEGWLNRTLTQEQWEALVEEVQQADMPLKIAELVEKYVLDVVFYTDILPDEE